MREEEHINYVVLKDTGTQRQYKYSEDKILEDIKDYIDKTYGLHYNNNDNIQVNDLLVANGIAEAFFRGNIVKYASRYGKKDGKNEADLMKMLHYGILLLNLTRNKSTKE